MVPEPVIARSVVPGGQEIKGGTRFRPDTAWPPAGGVTGSAWGTFGSGMPYSLKVVGALMIAPASRCKSMWLASIKGSVLKVPAGTIRWPPPALATAATALLKASVFRVLPSPLAP